MNSLLLGAVSNSVIADLIVAAFIVLYFLWGFHTGYAKPLTGIISWGVIVAIFYFGGSYIGNLLLDKAGLAALLEQGLSFIFENFEGAAPEVGVVINYIGLIIAALIIFVVIKIITFIINIIIKKARKPYKKSFWDRFFGALLNLIKGVFVAFIIISIVYTITKMYGITEVTLPLEEGTMTKYFVEYNPITMLFKLIATK